MDALVSSCAEQASHFGTLASMGLAGFAGRLAQFASTRSGLFGAGIFSQFAAKTFGLSVESGSFELCHRSFSDSLSQENFLAAWRRSFFHFGILHSTGHWLRAENFLMQQVCQASSLLVADWGVYGIGIGERPADSLSEQWLRHLGMGLALSAGSQLSIIFSGGLSRTLENRFSLANTIHHTHLSSRVLSMGARGPTPKEVILDSLALTQNLCNLSRSEAFLRLLHVRRSLETIRLRRGEKRIQLSFAEALEYFKTKGHKSFGGSSLNDDSIHRAARYLDHLYISWDREGAHYIRLAKMGPSHTHTNSQLEYAQEHLKLPEGEALISSSFGSLLRWAVFLAEHRDALELAEPFLIHNLSETTRLRYLEGPGFLELAKVLTPEILGIYPGEENFSFDRVLELTERLPSDHQEALLDAAARDQMREMERKGGSLEECSRDFVRITRWAFWRYHRGLKYSTTSDRLRAVILEGVVPLHNNHGIGSLVEFYEAWNRYVDPTQERKVELQDLYEVTLHNLKKWHLRCANRTPEAQILIRALRASVLRNFRGDLPLSFADEKHPLHRSVDEGEIPLVNTGALSLVEIYERYALLLTLNRYSKERIERLIMDALRAEHVAQELYLPSPDDTPDAVEILRNHFHEAILRRYRGCIPKKGEGALSDKSPLRHFHDRGIFPKQNRPGMPLVRMMELMREYALGSDPTRKDSLDFHALQNDAIDAAQGWKSTRELIEDPHVHYLHEIICEAWANKYGGPPPSIGEGALPLAHPLRRFVTKGVIGSGGSGTQRDEMHSTFMLAVFDLNPDPGSHQNLRTLLNAAMRALD